VFDPLSSEDLPPPDVEAADTLVGFANRSADFLAQFGSNALVRVQREEWEEAIKALKSALDAFDREVEAGEIKGYKMRFHLYTVPGQVFYNATRKLVLKGADGVVFVADSQDGMMDSNLESLYNLKKNLADHGINMDDFPVVLQYNKRDLPGVLPVDVLDKTLNNRGVPYFSASASTGEGVLETLTAVSKLVLGDLREMIETGRPRKRLPVPQEAIETETAGLRQERREDLRNWVESEVPAAAATSKKIEEMIVHDADTNVSMESIELGKSVPEVSRITNAVMEGILDVALKIRLRVVTAKDGDKIKVKEIEVSDYEPKEIVIKEGG